MGLHGWTNKAPRCRSHRDPLVDSAQEDPGGCFQELHDAIAQLDSERFTWQAALARVEDRHPPRSDFGSRNCG